MTQTFQAKVFINLKSAPAHCPRAFGWSPLPAAGRLSGLRSSLIQIFREVWNFGNCNLEFIWELVLEIFSHYRIAADISSFTVFTISAHPHPIKLVHDRFDEFRIGGHDA